MVNRASAPFDLAAIGRGLAFGPAHTQISRRLGDAVDAPLVIQAPPGSGKTTIVPPTVANALAAAGLGGRVIVTQPRRMAARAAARRLAQLDGSELGERIGFSVRGQSLSGPRTRIEFVTAGLLLRRLLADPDLASVGAVIVDEVHERSIETDLVLAMLNQVNQLRDDLALLVMSATLHAEDLAGYLGRGAAAGIISGSGIQHPVAEEFCSYSGTRNAERGLERGYLDHVAATAVEQTARNTAQGPARDTLVFVPGAGEVERVRALAAGDPRFEVLALHGQVEAAAQDAILQDPGPAARPRIIISTPIAESSLTVPRVNLVVDAGYAREPRRDAVRGMSGLVTVVASRASATQRAGRAGRLEPGRVVRTLDQRSFAAAPAFTSPQIATAELTQAALYLAAWGTPRGEGLELWQQPPAAALDDAESVLRSLGAIDESGQLTPAGQRLVQVPADPRLARALLEGARRFGPRAAAEAVAMLSGTERAGGADAGALLRELRRGGHPGHGPWAAETRRFAQLLRRQQAPAEVAPTPGAGAESAALAGVMALAYPQWVGRLVAGDEYLLASGTRASLPRHSPLHGHEFLAIADVARAGAGAVIRSAAGIELELLRDLLPQMHRVQTRAEFTAGKVSARQVQLLGAIELSTRPVKPNAEQAGAAVLRALQAEGLGIFGQQPKFQALRARLALAHRELGEPFTAMDEPALLQRADGWLQEGLQQMARGTAAAKVDLAQALRSLIPWQHAHDLDELLPERLQVPSGSRIALQYPEPGTAQGRVVAAVKLQECFGLAQTPRLLHGQVPIQFHLLSPAGRPLAVTDDLRSFWDGPYRQVRAEMRGRYPKHPWPENPWEHVATAKTKNRLR